MLLLMNTLSIIIEVYNIILFNRLFGIGCGIKYLSNCKNIIKIFEYHGVENFNCLFFYEEYYEIQLINNT